VTQPSRLLTDDELALLARSPRDELRVTLADPDADSEATVRSLVRAYDGSITGLQLWAATVQAFIAERGGVQALAGAVRAIFPLLEQSRGTAEPCPDVDEVAAAAAAGDERFVLARWDALEAGLRRRHGLTLDLLCLLLSHVYRTDGIDGLHESLRATGDHLLLSWMPRDVAQPPAKRIRSWTKMLKGNFASIEIAEDSDKFVITQDPCGTCGRQIRERGYPGPLGLAVVEEDDDLTFGSGGVPIYRTHIAVLHVELPEARRGTPWPVVRCPAGLAEGPCRILLFKDPDDTRAREFVGFER
jgi:hypothetical protein